MEAVRSAFELPTELKWKVRPGQLRIVDPAGGVVQDHDQVVPTLILKPLVIAAVDVKHHPRQWTPLTTLAMHTAPVALRFTRPAACNACLTHV